MTDTVSVGLRSGFYSIRIPRIPTVVLDFRTSARRPTPTLRFEHFRLPTRPNDIKFFRLSKMYTSFTLFHQGLENHE